MRDVARNVNVPTQVFLLTDGEVSNTDEVLALCGLHHKDTGARVFTFGIGNDVSHALIRGAAREGKLTVNDSRFTRTHTHTYTHTYTHIRTHTHTNAHTHTHTQMHTHITSPSRKHTFLLSRDGHSSDTTA